MYLSLNKKENLKLKIVLPYNILKMVKYFAENMLRERGTHTVYRKRTTL